MPKDLVAIHVGSGDIMATVYSSKTYLCDVSKIFHNAFMQGFQEAAEGVLCLPDDEPVSFRHIFQILKSGSPSPHPFRTVSKGQRSEMITDTYLEELAMACSLWTSATSYLARGRLCGNSRQLFKSSPSLNCL